MFAMSWCAEHPGEWSDRSADAYFAEAQRTRAFTERRVAKTNILKIALAWGAAMLLLKGVLAIACAP